MIAIMEVLKYEKNELKKCSSNKIIFAAANMLVNKEKPEEESIIKEIREMKQRQKIFKFEDNDKYSHIPFIVKISKGYSEKVEESFVCLMRRNKSVEELSQEWY